MLVAISIGGIERIALLETGRFKFRRGQLLRTCGWPMAGDGITRSTPWLRQPNYEQLFGFLFELFENPISHVFDVRLILEFEN
jgi:hypothetical protein